MLGEQARLPAFAVFKELHDDDAAACGEHAKGEAIAAVVLPLPSP